MKKLAFLYILFSVFLASCSAYDPSPKREVSAFIRQSAETAPKADLEIDGDYGALELFAGTGKELIYEATEKIRGKLTEEKLSERLKKFEIKHSTVKNNTSILFRYNGPDPDPIDTKIDMKIYLPNDISSLTIKLNTGRIKFHDDLNCKLSLDLGYVNTEINYFKGILEMDADMGDLKIGNGRISPNSSVKTGAGNLVIKSIMERGEYSFETGLGNIELSLPYYTALKLDYSGNIRTNEFENSNGGVVVLARSKIGEISIKKFYE